MYCKYCGRLAKSEKSNWIHQSRCKENPERFYQEPWNKGKIGLQTAWNKGKNIAGHPHNLETKKRLSQAAKERGLGGYVPGSGNGKKGWYKGIFCDSSWELAFVIYCLDNGIHVVRNNERRKYVFDGIESVYIPDFVVDGKLVEIKGYKTDRWEAKIKSNPDVTVYYKEEMAPILKYVSETYGDFLSMYEK